MLAHAMAIRVQRPGSVRRRILRRLPRRFRPVPRLAISLLVSAAAVVVVLAGIRLSAPAGPVLPSGPLFGMGALERRTVDLLKPGYWLYPERIPAEEGWVRVPGDHARPGQATLRVHYTRLDALPPDPQAEAPPPVSGDPRAATPIVYLADSSRGSGTRALLGPDFAALQALRGHGPVIVFDTRDSTHAEPALHCPGAWRIPDDAVMSPALLDQALAGPVRACALALTQAHAGLNFAPEQAVGDLEALRRALGLERIRLLAAGDGSDLALRYLGAHPHRVERAVLLAPQPPQQVAPRPGDVDKALARALDALHADPHWGPRLPEPRESLRVAIARLEVQPVTATVRDPLDGGSVELTLGGTDLRLAVLEHLGRSDGLEQLGRLLADVFAQRYQRLADTALALRRAPPPRAAVLAGRCASRADPAQLRRQRMTAAFTLLGNAARLLPSAQCAAWPTAPARTVQARWQPPMAPPPILLVAGDYDPTAPLEQVEALAHVLPGARLQRLPDSAPTARLDWALAQGADSDARVLAFLDADAAPLATQVQQPLLRTPAGLPDAGAGGGWVSP